MQRKSTYNIQTFIFFVHAEVCFGGKKQVSGKISDDKHLSDLESWQL